MEAGLKAAQVTANAAQISADVATQTLHFSQRAYLNVLGVYLDDFGPGKFPILVVEAQNSGHIPATVVSLSAAINFVTGLQNPRPTDLNWQPQNSVAPPGQVIKLSNHPEPNAPGFTDEQWNAIVGGKFYVAVFGAIRYEAGFGIIGETGFGYVFHANLFPHLEFHKKFATIDFSGYNYSR